MRIQLFLFGLFLPLSVSAASIFDAFWTNTLEVMPGSPPSEDSIDFVIESVKTWSYNGIILEKNDVLAALAGNDIKLCTEKKDTTGKDLNLGLGTAIGGSSCKSLQQDIIDLVAAERVAEILADDLLSLSISSELVIADEPREVMDIPIVMQGMKRLWQSSGATILPWDPAADEALNHLKDALYAEEDIPVMMLKFHHGKFRSDKEADPRFDGVGDRVGSALQFLADQLGIDPDTDDVQTIIAPPLGVENIRLWLRTDDLGLFWDVPIKEVHPGLIVPEEYPVYHEQGDRLAYPFFYEGTFNTPPKTLSPLCSRPMAKLGYLCRPLPEPSSLCKPKDSRAISLVSCPKDPIIKTVEQTTSVCLDTYPIYEDDGSTPLYDPNMPGVLNPALSKATPGTICQPEIRVQYPIGILQNLCYTDSCVRESMSGHSLIPGRNPVLAYESMSPYLACIRPDPELGFYSESPNDTATQIPPYLGVDLAIDYIRALCQTTGSVPHPLAGYCAYQDNIRAAVPTTIQADHFGKMAQEQEDVSILQTGVQSLAAISGLRLATSQAVLVHKNALQPLAAFIQQMADLFRELERAPPPDAACPWTGPIRYNVSGTP